MSLATRLKRKGRNGFGAASTAEEVTAGIDLSGKTYLITGAASGLGFETARVLGIRGARIVAAARTEASARDALVRADVVGIPAVCDLSEPRIVRDCISKLKSEVETLDGIICNAGIMHFSQLEVRHGLETQFLVNHMGHFILVTGLIDMLSKTARVVVLSSTAHRIAGKDVDFEHMDATSPYPAWRAYGRSKLANLLFAKHLAVRFAGTCRTANAVHPGVINTHIGRKMSGFMQGAFAAIGPLFLKSVPQGAATQCYVAAHPELAAASGLYFADCAPKRASAVAEDAGAAKRLFEISEDLAARL